MPLPDTLTDTVIANFAVTTLDDVLITELGVDGTPLDDFLAANYNFARDELLSLYAWGFAKKRAILTVDGTEPDFGWSYQYELPSDWLSSLPLENGGATNADEIPHEIEGGFLLCDVPDDLKYKYIFKVTDPTKFSPYFARALGQYLALMAAQRVTGKGSYVQKAQALYQDAIGAALAHNARNIGKHPDYAEQSAEDARLVGIYR